MNEQEKFRALFGKQGEYGSFNDGVKMQAIAETSPPLEDAQLRREIGLGGVNLPSNNGRQIEVSRFGFIERRICSSGTEYFFDNTVQKADETLF